MYKQYIMTETEVKKARNRLSEMRKIALMSRDAGTPAIIWSGT